MTIDTINKIRAVLWDKWPHKTYSPGLGYNTSRCNLLRLDADAYNPEPTWVWVGLRTCDDDEARNALTLAMLEWAANQGYMIYTEPPSNKWCVSGYGWSNKSLFDLLVEVVTKENK